MIADVNIFQGAIFHDDNADDLDVVDAVESDQPDIRRKDEENLGKAHVKKISKPAAHRVSVCIYNFIDRRIDQFTNVVFRRLDFIGYLH